MTPMKRCLPPIARGIDRSWKERYTRVSQAKLKPRRLGEKSPNGPSHVHPPATLHLRQPHDLYFRPPVHHSRAESRNTLARVLHCMTADVFSSHAHNINERESSRNSTRAGNP
jgi:hypothetical protein